MAITFKFDSLGGFYAHDEDARVIEYAYPSSYYATKAKKRPANVAAEMVNDAHVRATSIYAASRDWYIQRYERMVKAMEAV